MARPKQPIATSVRGVAVSAFDGMNEFGRSCGCDGL